jgi:hypothetical protein
MRRNSLIALLLITPTLFIVRAVVRYNEQQAAMDRMFGTQEQREAATARIIATQQKAEEAGAAVGAHETEQGCLEKGFERERSGPSEYGGLMSFLEGCLEKAQPTLGFCDSVPPYRATMSADDEKRSQAFRDSLCRKEGFTDLGCRAGLKIVQLHCHPLR